MNNLYQALTYNDTFTENSMPTHSSSGDYVIDMFFQMGGSRNLTPRKIVRMFEKALVHDKILAIKAMFYNRDIRGGQGERRSFQTMFAYLCEADKDAAQKVLALVPEYGRWDDMLVVLDTPLAKEAAMIISAAIRNGNVLAKKWMPRENKSKKEVAVKLMELLEMTPAQYRRFISVKGNEVVELQMCSNEWEKINYNHVPSIASKNYRTAFWRHDEARYKAWLDALEKGSPTAKINAGAIFPHDIIKQFFYGRTDTHRTLEAQWKALPDFVGEGLSFMPVVDVSGSMDGLPREVAVSLGIYLSERNKSVFKDGFVTFSERPTLQILKSKTLMGKIKQLNEAHWDMNTNLEAVFSLILSKAQGAKLLEEDMPTHIIILSDMQFDECVEQPSINAFSMIERMYEESGYKMPQLIFWNLRTSEGVPVKFDKKGTCLVSGFSPSIMKSLLAGELTPLKMMLAVLNSERYAPVEKALTS